MGVNNSRPFFVLLSVGAAIGIGNIWLYPYYSFNYTGLFFVPYLIALAVLGMPLLMLEFSVGQYFGKNVVDLFASIKKWFSSIGWLMVFNAFILMSFSAVILSWHIIYFFVSFGLQWQHDAKLYFFNNVLQVSDGFNSFTQFSLPVFIALIIAWLIVFFYIRKGFESMRKWFLATLLILAFLMLFFLAYSLTLENALAGVYSFLKPDLNGLLGLDVWVSSFTLAAISLGLSFGVMHALGRKSGRGFVFGNSLIIAIFEVLISIAVGFIVFGVIGFLGMKQMIGIGKLAFSDIGSVFTVLAQALPFFHKPTLLSLLFFAFLSIFFILGTSSLAYAISHVMVHKFKTRHVNAAIITSGFGFLVGLLFVIKPGFYIMDIIMHFAHYNVLIAVLLEAIAIGWFFDTGKIADFINQYSTLKIGAAWRLFVKYIVPFILLMLLFFQIKSDFRLDYGNYPLWAIVAFGVGSVAVPLVMAFLMPQKILDRK